MRDHHQQETGHLQKGTVCKIKYKLLQASSQERCTSKELYRVRKTVLPFAPMIRRRIHIGILSGSLGNAAGLIRNAEASTS